MIIGHQKQWKFLRKSVELGKIPHALLFSGQEQLGKRTLAIEFVKLINCQENDFSKKPCQKCRSCQDIEKGLHPDFVLVEPVSSHGPASLLSSGTSTGRGTQISQVRELIWKLSLHSYSAPFKSAIIDKAHLMTREAQNCFLKTLEEPKGKTLLIIITEYPEMLVSTILSRVQKLKFSPVKRNEIESYFKKQGISSKKAEYLLSFSSGRPGKAINCFLDNQKIKDQERFIQDIVKISNSDYIFRFKYAKNFSSEISDILETWLRYFRSLFLARISGQTKTENFKQYSLFKLKKIISLIQSTNYLISNTNVNPKLAFEVLLMEI